MRAARSSSRLAGVLDERCELAAQRRGVLGAQIDLIFRAIYPKPHRLICWAPIKIIFELDGYLLCHPRLLAALGLPAPCKINCNGRGYLRCRHPVQRMRPAGSDQLSSAPGMPITHKDRLVAADALGTTIK